MEKCVVKLFDRDLTAKSIISLSNLHSLPIQLHTFQYTAPARHYCRAWNRKRCIIDYGFLLSPDRSGHIESHTKPF